ncbi:MAG TPA: 23S rRNA (uracil(1939)-C(5))-methyltransferase RlmD [bacterium]|nr:23S rRNA (uracil(1939)-C(5))-methyltransferase RlmD [bacterium]
MNIILASQSERRKQLLKKIIPEFDIVIPEVEETVDGNSPETIAMENAKKKAINVAEKINNKNCVIISADTIVVVKQRILGKPANRDIARQYLLLLSGTTHRVITGICLFNPYENKMLADFDVTFVSFKTLTNQQIDSFLDKQTFYDKAGGYAIQQINDEFVEEIKGSYDNVVGLPVEKLKKMLDQFENLARIEIEDIALPDGWAVGRYNGKTVFVDAAVPGDTVWGRIVKNKVSYSYATNCGLIHKSHCRVEPVCSHFGLCGGCLLQSCDYNAQIELKKRYLAETLTRIGKIKTEFEICDIIRSPDIFFYRNKMEFAFGRDNGNAVLGLRERQSPLKKYKGYVCGIKKCFIFSDCIEKIFPIFLTYAAENNLEPYNPFTKTGIIRHLIIREAKHTHQIMVVFVTRPGMPADVSKLADAISSIRQVKSFWWVENDQISDVVNFQTKHLVYGMPFIEEKIMDLTFRIYPETFFQCNTKAAEKLYNEIGCLIESKQIQSVLGLFCGSGPIELFLSRKTKQVTGVDNNIVNISTAKENCAINNINNCYFYCQTAEEFLSQNQGNNKRFDAIIVDPPRAGLTNKLIKQIKSPIMIYVSCNAATLARDLSILTETGYIVKKVIPIDMFPHTAHIESCCLLELSGRLD